MIQDVTRLLLAEIWIQAHHDRADRCQRDEEDDGCRMVVRHHGDAVARLDAFCGKQRHSLVHARKRLRIGEPSITEFHEAMLGNGSRTAGEHAEKGVVVRLISPQDFERSHGQFRGQPRWCLNKGATRGIAGCCARAASGHAAAAPPRSVMNSRRFTGSTSRASDRKDSTPQLRRMTAALRDFGPTYVADGSILLKKAS